MLTRMRELKRVAVVGAGTMGSQIALQTALGGRYDVTLIDSVPAQLERAAASNKKLVDRAVEKGRMAADAAGATLGRIKSSADLAASVRDADMVIEAVIEDFDAKRAVFEALGKEAPKDAIFSSNSSTIAISRPAGFTARPEMCGNTPCFAPVAGVERC